MPQEPELTPSSNRSNSISWRLSNQLKLTHARLHQTRISMMQMLISVVVIACVSTGFVVIANQMGFSIKGLFIKDDADALRQQLLQMHERMNSMQNLKDQYASLANPLAHSAAQRSATADTKKEGLLTSNQMSSVNLSQENSSKKSSAKALAQEIPQDPQQLLAIATDMNKQLELAEQRWIAELLILHQLPTGSPIEKNAGMSSDYGTRIDPFTRQLAHHSGIDFVASHGTPILATGDGKVTSIGVDRNNGQYIDIGHESGFTTRYAHLSSFAVREGATVKRGQTIAAVGNTGRSTSAHLHYEIRYQGIPINPLQALNPRPEPKLASIKKLD